MRGLSAWSASLAAVAALASALPAAPVPAPVPAGPPLSGAAHLRAESLNYAHQLLNIVATIEMEYVRPVSRADLAEAALTGLYEAARQPVPASLKADLQRAGDGGDLLALLVRFREQLGDVDALRGNRALLVSLQALPRALDPYCGLTSPQEFRYLDLQEGVSATGLEFVGVTAPMLAGVVPGAGMVRGEVTFTFPPSGPAGPVRVQAVIPGSPAQRAGLRPADLIVKLDGRPPESPAFAGLLRRLLPPQPGLPTEPPAGLPPAVRLTLLRPGRAAPFDVTLAPAAFRPETVFGARRRGDGTWDYLLDPTERIGYVRLGAIGGGSHAEFRDALKSLRGQSVRGLVLDLRWCPGGYLRQAATIARLLLPDGSPVANQRARTGQVTPVLSGPEAIGEPHLDFPVVVLVGGETSGGGELIAAALQDSGRAVIAGQRTVGKATVQTELGRTYNIPFKLTTGTFVRPSGKSLQRYPDSKPSDDWGIRPDAGRELPLTAESSRRLREWWTLHALRPADSAEALPVDDPENDPQRQAAVQMVRELIRKP